MRRPPPRIRIRFASTSQSRMASNNARLRISPDAFERVKYRCTEADGRLN